LLQKAKNCAKKKKSIFLYETPGQEKTLNKDSERPCRGLSDKGLQLWEGMEYKKWSPPSKE